MKIAIAGISNESCSFSPLLSGDDEFMLVRGQELLDRCSFLTDASGMDVIPLIWARATPGGTVKRVTYEAIKQEMLQGLTDAMPIDGLYLDMHGALFVEGLEDAEGDWLQAIREIVGTACVISASYDLHGNVSQPVVDQLNLLTAYRTAPHVDVEETRSRAGRLLLDALQTGKTTHIQYKRVPVVLPGEMTATTWEPGTSLYNQIPFIIDEYDLVDASILIGYAWADEPRTSASIITIGHDESKTKEAVCYLASEYWNARHQFQFGAPADTIHACIEKAITASHKPVFISDSGDNITGGGVGDLTCMLKALLDAKVRKTLHVAIVDREAVTACISAGIDANITLTIGGKLDTIHGNPLTIQAVVKKIMAVEPNNYHVVVQVAGVTLILTEKRTAFTTLDQFNTLGLMLKDFDIVAIKLGYLFPELAEIAGTELLALSPGVIDQDLTTLDYQRITRPIYPLDPNMTWTPDHD